METKFITNIFIVEDKMIALNKRDLSKGYAIIPEYTSIRSGTGLLRYIQSLHEYQKNEELRKQQREESLRHIQSQLRLLRE